MKMPTLSITDPLPIVDTSAAQFIDFMTRFEFTRATAIAYSSHGCQSRKTVFERAL